MTYVDSPDSWDALGGLKVVTVFPPWEIENATACFPTNDYVLYSKTLNGGVINGIGVALVPGAYEISVAVYRDSAVYAGPIQAYASAPGELLSATAAADVSPSPFTNRPCVVALDAPVEVAAGDWLAVSCNDASKIFACTRAAAVATPLSSTLNMARGTAYVSDAADHPITDDPPGVSPSNHGLVVFGQKFVS